MKKVVQFFKGIYAKWKAIRANPNFYLMVFIGQSMAMVATAISIFVNKEPSRFDFIAYAFFTVLLFSSEAVQSFSKWYRQKYKRAYDIAVEDRRERLLELSKKVGNDPELSKAFLEQNGISVEEYVERGLEGIKKVEEELNKLIQLIYISPKGDNKTD